MCLLFDTQYPCLMFSIPAQCQCAPQSHCPQKEKPFAQSPSKPMCHRCLSFYGDTFLQTKHAEGTPPAVGSGITLW